MTTSILQATLTGGELSPSLYARVDLARYMTSLKTCRNFIVQAYGGIVRRPGFQFVSSAIDNTDPVRILPFQFNTEQTYILEFGDHYMRVYKDGDPVVFSSSPSEYSGGTTYSMGHVVKKTSGDTISYWVSTQDDNIGNTPSSSSDYWDSPGFSVLSGQPYATWTPYAADDLFQIQYVQNADTMTLVHSDYPIYQLQRTADDAWSFSVFENRNGPWLSQNYDTSKRVYSSGITGTVTLTADAAIFEDEHVGRLMYLEQKVWGKPWETGKSVNSGEIRRASDLYYVAASSGTTGTLRPSHSSDSESDGGVNWTYLHSGFGVARILTVAEDGLTATAEVQSRIPDAMVVSSGGVAKTIDDMVESINGEIRVTVVAHGYSTGALVALDTDWKTPFVEFSGVYEIKAVDVDTFDIVCPWERAPGYTHGSTFDTGTATLQSSGDADSPTYKWAFSAWGGVQGYPACVGYFQQRQIFANTPAEPNTLWVSVTADYTNFVESTPGVDDDAFNLTVASRQVNAISGILDMDKLILLTSGGNWIVGSGQDDVLTPTNRGLKFQSSYGSNGMQPINIGDGAVYVQSKGQAIRSIGYEFVQDKYRGDDLTTMASHLFEGVEAISWAWQQYPNQCLWVVTSGGDLLGCTYFPEQTVIGWHRHDSQDCAFSDVAVVSEGGEDVLYAVVYRDGIGKTIERMASRIASSEEYEFYVDCGLRYNGWNTGSTTVTFSGGIAWDETELITVTASAPTWGSSGQEGNQVVVRDSYGVFYRLTITEHVSTTVLRGVLNRELPAEYRSTATAVWGLAVDQVTASHLANKEVSILADGCVVPIQTADESGSITLQSPAVVVHMGLPFDSDAETLELASPQESISDKKKIIPTVRVRLLGSRSLLAATKFGSNMVQVARRSPDSSYDDTAASSQEGYVTGRIIGTWEKSGRVALRCSDPVACTIQAIVPEVAFGGAA